MSAAIEQRARDLVAHVQGVYDDGGYAAGDSEPFPLDEMKWLLDEIEALRSLVRRSSVAGVGKLTKAEGDALERALRGNQEEYDRG